MRTILNEQDSSYFLESKPLNLKELPETKLADSWAVEIDEKYYRDNELEKVKFRQLPGERSRKEDPFGPFASVEEKTDFKYWFHFLTRAIDAIQCLTVYSRF